MSILGRFLSTSKASMRPTSTVNLFSPVTKYKLPLTLQSKIKTQVSENPNSFVKQILNGGNPLSATYPAHPRFAYLKMAQPSTNELGRFSSFKLMFLLNASSNL